ncbi:MAG: FAD-dependent oxidoreductase [bacterium]
MNGSDKILIIGAGIAGMQASLMLAKAGKKVILVEKLPIIGGNTIKNEESFPNLECSTCMVAPIQQEVLQNENIEVMTLSEVQKAEGQTGNFNIKINKKARYVSITDCIGCGACYDPCPISLKNEWEENLAEKKAIYVPCDGSLPNVPVIDPVHCLQISGKKNCNACAEACMFGAIDFSEKDEEVEVGVGAIIVATGFDLFDAKKIKNLGYGKYPNVYTSMEFERLYASNGPTSGELVLRKGKKSPDSVAIIHCIGRKELGYCSSVCCMSSFKYTHFIKDKLPEAKIYNIYSDICVPDKTYQNFYNKIKNSNNTFIFKPPAEDIQISGNNGTLKVNLPDDKSSVKPLDVDMVILSCALVPSETSEKLGKILSLEIDNKGFFNIQRDNTGTVKTSIEGIFIIGCAEGPKDIQNSVIQAESAVGEVISLLG